MLLAVLITIILILPAQSASIKILVYIREGGWIMSWISIKKASAHHFPDLSGIGS
jgi:hypothetical protein